MRACKSDVPWQELFQAPTHQRRQLLETHAPPLDELLSACWRRSIRLALWCTAEGWYATIDTAVLYQGPSTSSGSVLCKEPKDTYLPSAGPLPTPTQAAYELVALLGTTHL